MRLSMSTAEMRRRIKKSVDTLSGARLRELASIIRELREQEEATAELLAIPGLLDRVRGGLREVEEGKTVSVRKLRRKY
jgi:hypothetical protein